MNIITYFFPNTPSKIILTLLFIYMFLSIYSLLLDNHKNASETVVWVLVIILIPILGLATYIVFGRNWRIHNKKIRRRMKTFFFEIIESNKANFANQIENIKIIEERYHNYGIGKLLYLMHSGLNQIPYNAEDIKIINKGHKKFELLIKDLEKAEKYIHMEYFIWKSNGDYTNRIRDILIKKAKQGVEVKIIYDLIGCIFSLKKKDKKLMRKAGIKIYSDFHKFDRINRRNHCKIVIIDGKVAYTGGMNLADEYATGGKRFPAWRDSHLRIEGEFIFLLQTIFATHWFLATKEKIIDSKYFKFKKSKQNIPLQMVYSGPDTSRDFVHEMFIGMINSAKDSIHIQSPYFIPDVAIAKALKIAALSGVEIKIILTGCKNIDKKLPYYAAYTYFEELLRAGAKIYHYKEGFYHTKGLIIDGKLATLGTANMDVRSFKLNSELNVVIFDKGKSEEVEKQFKKDLKQSKEFTLEDYEKLPTLDKLRNGLARLLSGAL